MYDLDYLSWSCCPLRDVSSPCSPPQVGNQKYLGDFGSPLRAARISHDAPQSTLLPSTAGTTHCTRGRLVQQQQN